MTWQFGQCAGKFSVGFGKVGRNSAGRSLIGFGHVHIEADNRWLVTRDGIDAVLVPPADAPALAAAMSALLDDPARRAALGDEARRRFLQHFDIARVAPAIVDMLRASIAAHQVG